MTKLKNSLTKFKQRLPQDLERDEGANRNSSPMERVIDIASRNRRYRVQLYELIAEACRIADELNSPRKWREFVEHEYWSDKEKRPQVADLIYKRSAVFEVAFADVEAKICGEYRLAAEALLSDYGAEALVEQFVARGGIRAVLNDARRAARKKPSPASSGARAYPNVQTSR